MLETDEVDDDYFTPLGRTSLASIFKKPLASEKADNETLKYSPPIPREEDQQCKRIYDNLFSCVFDAYQWLDNVYIHKGELGCAIVKLSTGESQFHSILLYDSKKATISSAAVTKEFEVTVKGKDFISYYDRFEKYWCLYGSEDDIEKTIDILKSFGVKIKALQESDNVLPEHNKPETSDVKSIKHYTNIGSDTDSYINRKTKASILNRMANMGQSVLPPHTISCTQTSNSSDTESDNHIVAIRSKLVKNNIKRNVIEKPVTEKRKADALKKAIVPCNNQAMESITYMTDDQLFPKQASSTMTSTSGNDLNFFISEQRIANSELRINLTRMTDKVDNIMDKINVLEIRDKNKETNNMNTEILRKLLNEYENKIKAYEDLFKKVENNSKLLTTDLLEDKNKVMINNELQMLKNKVNELDKCIKQKDDDISILNNVIEDLKQGNNNNVQCLKDIEDEYQAKMSALQDKLLEKNMVVAQMSLQNEDLTRIKSDQLENNIKTIMNDTFQAVAVNFDNDESYSGETIKNIIATVIKKVTIELLNNSK